jgi:hypothetical protein
MPKEPSYTEIRDSLKNLPITWYPALLCTIVEEACKAGVFKPGGAALLAKKVETEQANRKTKV